MAELSKGPPITNYLSWRNPDFRSVVYQVLVLASTVSAGYIIFQNTLANLTKRGISSGFKFLDNESGFGISEVMPIPQLEGGFIHFLTAIFVGVLAGFLLNKWMASKGKGIGDDYRLILLMVFLVVGLPAIVYYSTRQTIVTETYDEAKSYGLALVTGMINTIKVSVLACIFSTIIGFLVGIARLSSNWLVSRLSGAYVETFRNIPILLQIFFWYFAVIRTLPGVQQSLNIFDVIIVNNRGIYLPDPLPLDGYHPFLFALFFAFLGIYFWKRHVTAVRDRTGRQIPAFLPSLGLLIVLPGLSWLVLGAPVELTYPVLEGFNFEGGMVLTPEYASMMVALSMYHATYIAEIVRSGIQAVDRGQKEAAGALGLRGAHVMRLVVIPQAMRVIIPPLTSQYLSLTKNSSLGVAIGHPELVSVGGTILNQSGQAIEVIGITMAVYLIFSLLISVYMNWYNVKVKLVER